MKAKRQVKLGEAWPRGTPAYVTSPHLIESSLFDAAHDAAICADGIIGDVNYQLSEDSCDTLRDIIYEFLKENKENK